MIRIDEIYYNVFVRALQHRSQISAHWFDPFGSTQFEDIVCSHFINNKKNDAVRFLFWDQEPTHIDTFKPTLEKFVSIYDGDTTVITSEVDSKSVEWACNTYGIKSAYYFFHGWAALDWYRGYNHSYLSTPWQLRNFHHRIFSPNNIVGGKRAHRLSLMSEMDQRGLLINNLVSFPAVCPHEREDVRDLLVKHRLPQLKTPLPLIIDHGDNHAGASHRIDFWDQAQSCFCHVVTETVYESTRIHLTEKVFKPIVLQQPFMLVSARGSLDYLRGYGFQTFDTLWSEAYDQADDDIRIKMIADNLEQINNWTPAELQDATYQAQSIVKHNFDWFYSGFQDLLWTELTEMIDPWR